MPRIIDFFALGILRFDYYSSAAVLVLFRNHFKRKACIRWPIEYFLVRGTLVNRWECLTAFPTALSATVNQ